MSRPFLLLRLETSGLYCTSSSFSASSIPYVFGLLQISWNYTLPSKHVVLPRPCFFTQGLWQCPQDCNSLSASTLLFVFLKCTSNHVTLQNCLTTSVVPLDCEGLFTKSEHSFMPVPKRQEEFAQWTNGFHLDNWWEQKGTLEVALFLLFKDIKMYITFLFIIHKKQ